VTHLTLSDTPYIDHRVDRSEIGDQHRSSLVKGEAVRDPHANSRQSSRVGRESVLPAEANDTIADLQVVFVNVCSHTGNDSSCFYSKQTHGEFNDAQSNKDILRSTY
jgi:hypothetical protein